MIFGKYLNKYYKKYFWAFLIGVIALIIVDLLQIQVPIIIGNITDGIVEGGVKEQYLVNKALYLLLIGFSIGFGRFLWRNLIFGASRNIEFSLRNEIFSHLEKLSQKYFNQHKTGDLMAHATNDINAVRMAIGPGLLMIVDATVLIALVLYNMAYIVDLKLTLIAIIPFPLIIFQGFIMSKFMKQRFKEKQEAFAEMTDMVQESFSGIRVIKAFIQEYKEIQAFSKTNENNFNKNIRLAKLRSAIEPIITVVVGLSLILTLIYGGRLTMVGEISLGELVAFINFLTMLVWPMMAIGMVLNVIAQGKASLDRIEKILDEVPEVFDSNEVLDIKDIKGNIRISNLSFKYPNSKEYVLKNINLNIGQGKTIGIIGRTGAGKTTLVNLLLRVYNVPDQRIFFDDQDIMKIPLNKLRENIGYVPQDNFLFSDTISRNIAFGVDNLEIDKVMKYAQLSSVHENIIEFKEGYETLVGERGITLSGGQKQRISIARALIKEAPILILDDGVSAVDTDTEEKILSAIKTQRKNKTTIIIAHRISTIKHSDHIIFLDEGNVIEEGTHEELVGINGQYNSIVKKQQLADMMKNQ
ncbi:MAG: ABC transporter ATP-binding protein/permease [Maledivibacter sp.]|jgi:ATP-binding cassette subfamily B protein|nr:ABC transporter ATP-binding protein/permease [Maledivibacter sp.]